MKALLEPAHVNNMTVHLLALKDMASLQSSHFAVETREAVALELSWNEIND